MENVFSLSSDGCFTRSSERSSETSLYRLPLAQLLWHRGWCLHSVRDMMHQSVSWLKMVSFVKIINQQQISFKRTLDFASNISFYWPEISSWLWFGGIVLQNYFIFFGFVFWMIYCPGGTFFPTEKKIQILLTLVNFCRGLKGCQENVTSFALLQGL